MLVDLHRNDLGKVARAASVRVPDFMIVEYYSHLMHIVSSVTAKIRPECSALDALLAAFPAGTLSGAPKIRAMEIIDELEPEARGPYGGAIGYFSFSGDMDTCITIRTVVIKDGEASVTAGAGIVADSDPAAEVRETETKAAAMLQALALAEALQARDEAGSSRVETGAAAPPPRTPRASQEKLMILVVDNYDSFTYNLVQLLLSLGREVEVKRNDALPVEGVLALEPEAIVLSPGPGRPEDAGICVELLQSGTAVPILGVCLGHQALGLACGGTIELAPVLMHGKTSQVTHQDRAIFDGLPNPFEATRYHSLRVADRDFPPASRCWRAAKMRRSWAWRTATCRTGASSSIPSRSSPARVGRSWSDSSSSQRARAAWWERSADDDPRGVDAGGSADRARARRARALDRRPRSLPRSRWSRCSGG